MILREFPDLPPRPPTPANIGFRRSFYQRWGRENALLLATARRVEFVPYTQRLSIKCAWGGAEHYLLPDRRLAVDAEHYLVLNDGEHYGARIASPTPVTSMSVFFRPGMADELNAAATLAPGQWLERETESGRRPLAFGQQLRPHDAGLHAQLLALRAAVEAGADDEDWLEERLQALLWALRAIEPGVRERSRRIAGASRSAHAELLARIDRAADFLLSCHAEPVTLDRVAAVARLSKYHLVRLFRQVHGVTPFAFLARKRTQVARELIERSDLGLDEIVELSGFGSRATMFRQLRVRCGNGGRALRRRTEKV